MEEINIRPLKILGLRATLLAREFEATFGDIGMQFRDDYAHAIFRSDMVSRIDRENAFTCLRIAELYSEMNNKQMKDKYDNMAEKYAFISSMFSSQ